MNIVVVNNLPRFPGTPRWDFDLVQYEDFIDHAAHRVHYLANARGMSGLPAAPAASTRELPRLDREHLQPALAAIRAQHGPIDRLVVFSESLQDLCAELREEFAIPGKRPEENRLGRDMLVMKARVQAAGLRAPRYQGLRAGDLADAAAALAFAAATGWPLILKPVDGQSSQGVQRIEDEAALRQALAALPAGTRWDLEEYIAGHLLHVDGLVDPQGEVRLVVPSRYVNTCLDFAQGAPLGAIMLPPGTPLHERASRFTADCVRAIGLRGCPFHLELFHTPDDELVFLEVGARVGGADVPSVIHRATGLNLFGEWVRMGLGQPATLAAPARSIGAWLMFPRPGGLPRRVVSVTRFDDGRLPTLYRQLVPDEGARLEHEDGYCSMQAGRFLFDGATAAQVAKDVEHVLNAFSLTTAEV